MFIFVGSIARSEIQTKKKKKKKKKKRETLAPCNNPGTVAPGHIGSRELLEELDVLVLPRRVDLAALGFPHKVTHLLFSCLGRSAFFAAGKRRRSRVDAKSGASQGDTNGLAHYAGGHRSARPGRDTEARLW